MRKAANRLLRLTARTVAVVGLAGLISAGCAPRVATPPPKAPSHAKVQKNKAKERKGAPLVAPPPAYGNKVVMAKEDGTTGTF